MTFPRLSPTIIPDLMPDSDGLTHSLDYYSASAEFGMTMDEVTPSALSALDITVGYDPLFMTYVDESQSRTFPIGTWEIDFGDGCMYGLTSGERHYLSAYMFGQWNEASATAYNELSSVQHTSYPITELSSVFRIPGDIELMFDPSVDRIGYTKEQSVKQFSVTNVMNPADWEKCSILNREGISYPTMSSLGGAVRTQTGVVMSAAGNTHVTKMILSGDSIKRRADYYGDVSGMGIEPTGPDNDVYHDFQYDEIFKTVATGAHVYYDNLLPDDCNKIGQGLYINKTERPVFGHMYKGPGVYTAFYKIKPRSKADYYGQLLDESNFVSAGSEYLTKTVLVRPTCPCVRLRVYDTYLRDENNDIVTDDNGHKVFLRGNIDGKQHAKLMQAALSSTEYSADDPENYGENYSYIDFNPSVFRLYDRDHEKIFDGVSGYAPFVRASCKCMVRPNSFPISAVSIDNGDWFSDRVRGEETVELGKYSVGWPYWAPDNVSNGLWNVNKRAVEFTNTHTFLMPGLYRAQAKIHYDMERIPDFWHTELSACDTYQMGNYYVLVKEIMPKNPVISASFVDANSYGDTTFKFRFLVSAGSFPIEDVVWDFDDGTERLTLTRNTDGGYKSGRIEKRNTTAQYIGNLHYDDGLESYNYNREGTDYGSLDASAGLRFASGGSIDGTYPEYDPRDWEITHTFYRSAVSQIKELNISAIGYVANTGSMTVATNRIAASALPDFKTIEGDVRIIDTRLSTDRDNLILTMEGSNNGTTNLYSMEWKDIHE